MLKKKTVFVLIFMLLITMGCTSNPEKEAKTSDHQSSINNIEKEIKTMIGQADASRKKAASVSGEWRDTGKFIKKAKAALKDGKYEKAIKLAKKAKREGDLGYQQMVNQKEFKMPGYFKF